MQIKRDFSVKNIGSYPMTMNKARRQVGIAGKERRRRTRGRMVRTQMAKGLHAEGEWSARRGRTGEDK